MNWTHTAPAVLAAFLGSFVEFVEALTIVLAVGVTRGWRSSLAGAFAGAAILIVLVVALGPNLQSAPIAVLQIVIGVLLLFFGTRWLRKAILRAAGVLGLHDEEKIYQRQTRALISTSWRQAQAMDTLGFLTSLKAVFIEGLEVVFIVIAVGATGKMLLPASVGALAAGAVVIGLGLLLHKPLTRVPENTLKLTVGVLLSAFGVFWIGEGLGFKWAGGDWVIVVLISGFLITAFVTINLIRKRTVTWPEARVAP